MARRSSGEGTITKGSDGWWHVYMSLGTDPATGKRRRVHARGRTRSEVESKLKEMRQASDRGTGRMTVREWFDAWLDAVDRSLKPRTVGVYRTHTRYLVAGLGHLRLDKLTTEHIEGLYRSLAERGLSATSIQGVHRSIRASLNEAVRRGRLTRNPATYARPGRADEHEVEPLSTEEAQAILNAASGERNAARWGIALGLGLRQGEALGLCWDDVDLDNRTIRIRRALQRVPWRHGCKHRPCGQSPARCPMRQGGGLRTMDPKSRSGRRTIVLPERIVTELRQHRVRQLEERVAAGEMWQQGPDGGWVFARATGEPIDPSRDWKNWKALLTKAGVRDVRLHDARHSAATYLLVQGVDARTVMGIMGWSQISLTARYQHVVPELQREAANRMEQLLWGGPGGSSSSAV
jgi:integrase